MANKSKKNKNYRSLKDSANRKAGFFGGEDKGKTTNAFGMGIDSSTGKIKNIKGITIAVIVAILMFVGVRIWAGYQATGYDVTAQPYMAKVIPELSKWDADVLRLYMAPETMTNISEYDLKTVMASFTKLGSLRSMEEPEFRSVNSIKSRDGVESTILTYNIRAKYLYGDADLIMVLKQTGDSYEVYRFNVDSKVLSQ